VSSSYHTKYYAHALLRRSPSDSLDKLGQSLLNATVDQNPHQRRARKLELSWVGKENRPGLKSPDNIEVKKIPRDLLAKCSLEEDK
jgi:hypothetical protein